MISTEEILILQAADTSRMGVPEGLEGGDKMLFQIDGNGTLTEREAGPQILVCSTLKS